MGTEFLPQSIHDKYEVHEWKHACAILKNDFPAEWNDIVALLEQFHFCRSWINVGGGAKTKMSQAIDDFLIPRGWVEKKFETSVTVDESVMNSPTHKVDCYKNKVALEFEWNNKDTFYDRDLNNFRLLFDLRAISVGVIITRCDELQDVFDVVIGRKAAREKYGATTTHMSKLLPRLEGGGGGGCPVLAFGIRKVLYVEDA